MKQTPLVRRTPLRSGAKRLAPRRTRPRTFKAERRVDLERLRRVRALPCLGCLLDGVRQTSPTEAHHIRRKADGSTYGASQKAHDDETIPLCSRAHHWNGVHVASKLSHKEFERRYGNERELLELVDLALKLGNAATEAGYAADEFSASTLVSIVTKSASGPEHVDICGSNDRVFIPKVPQMTPARLGETSGCLNGK